MMNADTKIVAQWRGYKKQYPDTIVLIQYGDFFETFEDDARTVAKVLGICLTIRKKGEAVALPMAGVPSHAILSYTKLLLEAGHRVARVEIGDAGLPTERSRVAVAEVEPPLAALEVKEGMQVHFHRKVTGQDIVGIVDYVARQPAGNLPAYASVTGDDGLTHHVDLRLLREAKTWQNKQ